MQCHFFFQKIITTDIKILTSGFLLVYFLSSSHTYSRKGHTAGKVNGVLHQSGDTPLRAALEYLTHWGRVTHICVSKLTIIGSGDAWPAPSHYLNQCWNVVNWTLENKLQWNFNQNSNIFIQENALENVICVMAFILSRPQCVNSCHAEFI